MCSKHTSGPLTRVDSFPYAASRRIGSVPNVFLLCEHRILLSSPCSTHSNRCDPGKGCTRRLRPNYWLLFGALALVIPACCDVGSAGYCTCPRGQRDAVILQLSKH